MPKQCFERDTDVCKTLKLEVFSIFVEIKRRW